MAGKKVPGGLIKKSTAKLRSANFYLVAINELKINYYITRYALSPVRLQVCYKILQICIEYVDLNIKMRIVSVRGEFGVPQCEFHLKTNAGET